MKDIVKTSKPCYIDPIPTELLRLCLDKLLPYLAEIVNKIFIEANPLLKKCGLLNRNVFNNFKPVSKFSQEAF